MGTREYTTDVYDPNLPVEGGLIGPATFIWDTPSKQPSADEGADPATTRQALIYVHPTINKQLHRAITKFVGASLISVAVTPFVKEFLTFETTGRRATEVVKAVLRPVLATDAATKEVSRSDVEGEGKQC